MDSTSTLAQAKSAVFGKDPALGTDGQPLERGVGSRWHRADHIAKANFHAANAWSLCDGLVSQAKALLATAETIAAASKASIEAAAAAKEEAPVPADPKDDQVYKDLQAHYDQVVAERDVLTKLPAATAHNVALDAAEQKLLDDYRAEQKRIKELEAILNEPDKPVVVNPDGSVAPVVPTDIKPAENSKLSFLGG